MAMIRIIRGCYFRQIQQFCQPDFFATAFFTPPDFLFFTGKKFLSKKSIFLSLPC